MSTGEGDTNPRDGQTPSEDNHRGHSDRIGVGGGDDSVSRIQLAGRWAEAYATESDSLGAMLRRFRTAYEYLDAVIHGVEPPELDSVAEQTPAAPGAAAQPAAWTKPEPAPPPWASPTPPEPGAPQGEQRPWG